MTDQKKLQINYISSEYYRLIHNALSIAFMEDGEPIPPFESGDMKAVDYLVNAPMMDYYATLAQKAAIIFYTINKRHIFPNGNKRFSVACLSIFLIINGKRIVANADELTKIALELAKTTHTDDFDNVKSALNEWIIKNIEDLEI
jgi:death-on-curing family protein